MSGKTVVAHFDPDGLTQLDRNKTLEDMNLIKDKRCGKIKGRTCSNGSKQRNYLKPDESVYSPTCSTEALMETFVIDAMEKRYVAIFYGIGAYLQMALPAEKNLRTKIGAEFVDMICEVNPEYIPYVRYENGKSYCT